MRYELASATACWQLAIDVVDQCLPCQNVGLEDFNHSPYARATPVLPHVSFAMLRALTMC
jgi:hypothetical protein